jgi:hypothetical protein
MQLLNTISPPFHASKFNYYKFIPFLLHKRTQQYCSQNEHKKSPLTQAALSARTTSTTVYPNIKTPRIHVRIPLPPLLLGRISSSSAKLPRLLQYYYHHYPPCCHRHHHHYNQDLRPPPPLPPLLPPPPYSLHCCQRCNNLVTFLLKKSEKLK